MGRIFEANIPASIMQSTVFVLGLISVLEGVLPLTWVDKGIFYQDCGIFNKTDLYAGPVCGSDGVTYANSLYLDCVNYKNFRNVATMHPGSCLKEDEYCKANLFYQPVCGTDGETYSNLESLLCVNYKFSRNIVEASKGVCDELDHCYRHGITFYGHNPVCANNGYTYQNAAQVKCLQRRNSEIKILHDGGCTVRDVYKIYGMSEEVCDIARNRYEWNPVCASDGITFSNPFEFLCYEADLKSLASNNECGTSTHNSCAQLESAGNDAEAFGPEDEVCGNDGVTYPSIHHLQCYSIHNKYLMPKHNGSCSGPDDSPCGSIPEEELRLPVCGSDNLSYVSPEALWCARLRYPEKKLKFVHDGPC